MTDVVMVLLLLLGLGAVAIPGGMIFLKRRPAALGLWYAAHTLLLAAFAVWYMADFFQRNGVGFSFVWVAFCVVAAGVLIVAFSLNYLLLRTRYRRTFERSDKSPMP